MIKKTLVGFITLILSAGSIVGVVAIVTKTDYGHLLLIIPISVFFVALSFLIGDSIITDVERDKK